MCAIVWTSCGILIDHSRKKLANTTGEQNNIGFKKKKKVTRTLKSLHRFGSGIICKHVPAAPCFVPLYIARFPNSPLRPVALP